MNGIRPRPAMKTSDRCILEGSGWIVPSGHPMRGDVKRKNWITIHIHNSTADRHFGKAQAPFCPTSGLESADMIETISVVASSI
jgi:hypothetical protein